MNLIFDIETDGLYHDVTCIHCIGIYDLDANETYVYNDQGDKPPITQAITFLEDADSIIGHNIIGYDIPAIQSIYPFFTPPKNVIDTLVLSRVYHANMLDIDYKRQMEKMPAQLYGRHSLESWGYRLGEYKGGFSKQTDWKEWSQDMQDYCLQDVAVTKKLWRHFLKYLNSSN